MTMYSPRFCYANYIKNDDITVSTNSDIKTRLIDRNAERKWVSTSGDETGTLTFTVTDEIDTIVIQNTNASVFTIKYNTSTNFDPVLSNAVVTGETINIIDSSNNFLVDGSGTFIVSAGVATRVYNSFYFKFTAVTPTTNVVISVTNTTDGNALKCGQVIITKQIHELKASGSMRIPSNTKQFLKELSDGTINKVYVRKNNSYDLTLNNVGYQERANLELMYDINKREAILFIARPAMYTDVFDGLCDHVNWVNEFDFNDYYNDLVVNGFTGTMQLRACGGIS
jgi:hypothetical protein